jgi:hypothetical protein
MWHGFIINSVIEGRHNACGDGDLALSPSWGLCTVGIIASANEPFAYRTPQPLDVYVQMQTASRPALSELASLLTKTE